jgi:beta-N-acetylhexosaminidase
MQTLKKERFCGESFLSVTRMRRTMPAHSLLMIDLSGTTLTPDERALLGDYHVGGVCLFRRNWQDREHLTDLCAELRQLCGEDVVIGIDQEGGTVVRVLDVPFSPGNMALGAVDDVETTRAVASVTARGLKAIGITLNLAPVADVNNNPNNPVIGDRSFGSDAKKVAKHVIAFVQGMQAEGVAATVKHFPGHGNTATDSHHALPKLDVTLEQLFETELVPFRAGMAAGVACVMSYHGIVSALDAENPATLSSKVMTLFLRDTLGFDGVSFSDALEMKAVAETYGPEESAVRAVAAGIDMPLYNVHQTSVKQHEAIFKALDEAVEQGRLAAEGVKRSRQRLTRLARRYPATPNPNLAWQGGDQDLLEQAAKRAVVVVGQLPTLNKDTPITLVAASNDVGGSASDITATPAYTLLEKLRAASLTVKPVFYDNASVDVDTIQKQRGGTVIFVSASRTRLKEDEIRLAQQVANQSQSFIHIALWNPYSIQHVPHPAIVSFGFQEASLNQVVDVLLGIKSEGSLPFGLGV